MKTKELNRHISDLSELFTREELNIKYEKKPVQRFIKRFIDIIMSSVFLAVLSPVILFIMLLLKIELKKSIFFKQERIGINKSKFTMYKFRTMVLDADKKISEIQNLNESNSIMFKSQNDPRVTKLGKFLRKYSLDEIPQLINILKGDMSLVGPRPPIQREVDKYEKWQEVRFVEKPGLTGLWQVSGRSKIKDFDSVIALDFLYIKNWNFLLDLRIMLRTIPVVLFGDKY